MLLVSNTRWEPWQPANQVLLAADAREWAVSNNIGPEAYYHNGYIYYVYPSAHIYPYVGKIQCSTGNVTASIQAGSATPSFVDAHGAPCIIRDNNGYIHVFYGCHYSPLKHSRSNFPDDISAWTPQDDVDSTATYPYVVQVGASFYLFYRFGETSDAFRISTDNMASFSERTEFLTDAGAYAGMYHGNFEYDPINGRVHFVWFFERQKNPSIWINAYYAYMRLSDKHLFSASGTDLGTQIGASEADAYCKFLNFSSLVIQPFAIVHLSGQTPFITYFDGSFKFIKWTGTAWSAPVIIWGLSDVSEYADFIVTGAHIEVYLCDSDGNIRKYVSSNGGNSWVLARKYSEKSANALNPSIPQVVKDSSSAFKVIVGEHGNVGQNISLYMIS